MTLELSELCERFSVRIIPWLLQSSQFKDQRRTSGIQGMLGVHSTVMRFRIQYLPSKDLCYFILIRKVIHLVCSPNVIFLSFVFRQRDSLGGGGLPVKKKRI